MYGVNLNITGQRESKAVPEAFRLFTVNDMKWSEIIISCVSESTVLSAREPLPPAGWVIHPSLYTFFITLREP